MHLFINALAASAGSGPTYVRNVVPQLASRKDVQTTFWLRPELRSLLGRYDNVSFIETASSLNAGRRFLYEQKVLPELIREAGADVLISAGNFALRSSPVPQILLSGNSLYLSSDFFRDLRSRRHYYLWLDTMVKGIFARRSVKWADVTVAPSAAFAAQLRNWASGKVISIHHGFDRETFLGNADPLGSEIENMLASSGGDFRLLFVSHYNYYRNFETLFRALPIIKQRLPGRRVQLLLTCRLRDNENPGRYEVDAAARLVKELGIAADLVELGTVPYSQLHHVYKRCHVYVTPAYAESFAHPLVEAMASGRPVVASDLEVHREVCGDAALYFPKFSADELASRVVEVAENPRCAESLSANGLRRSRDFSWSQHVRQLVDLAKSLA